MNYATHLWKEVRQNGVEVRLGFVDQDLPGLAVDHQRDEKGKKGLAVHTN